MCFKKKDKTLLISDDRKEGLTTLHSLLNCIGYYYNIKDNFDLNIYYKKLLRYLYCSTSTEEIDLIFQMESTIHDLINEFLKGKCSNDEMQFFSSLKYKDEKVIEYDKRNSLMYTYVSNAFVDGDRYRSGYCSFLFACATNSSGLRYFDYDNGVLSIPGYEHKSIYYARKLEKPKIVGIYRNKHLEMEITLNDELEPVIINSDSKYTFVCKSKDFFSIYDKEYIERLNGKKPNRNFEFFGAKICELEKDNRLVGIYSPNRDKMDKHLCLLTLITIINLRRMAKDN